MTHAFSDLLDPGLLDQAATPIRPRTCCRCERLAAVAQKAGMPVPPVADVESWLVARRRYFSGLCKPCADWEWSRRWSLKFEQAQKAGELSKMTALERERQTRLSKGREFYAQARGT